MALCRAGKQYAFQELYKKHSKTMYNLCLRMLNNHEEAQDVLQESFVLAFQRLAQLKEEEAFGSWLKRITVNQCLNALNKRKLVWMDLDESHLSDENLAEPGEQDWNIDEIIGTMKKLPDGYRVILTLYAFENYSHKMIAERLGISEGTSKSQYARAKQKLATLLHQKKEHHER